MGNIPGQPQQIPPPPKSFILTSMNTPISISGSLRDIKKGSSLLNYPFLVIRLGLEPRTPTLKVLCSTS